MTLDDVFSSSWLGLWRAMRTYHRYTVEGFENVAAPGAGLIVGYHARGFAVDLCILSVEMYERLGYLPHAIFHEALGRLPIFRNALKAIGGVTGDGPSLERAVARNEHLIVLPGGAREAFQPACGGARVDWGNRTGYLRLAFRLGLPLIPVVSQGADRLYLGLNDGYSAGKRVGMPLNLPCWFGFGATGVYPMSLPFPVRLRQLVGRRIELDAAGPLDADDPASFLRLHAHVTSRMQELLDRATAGKGLPASLEGRPHGG